MIKNKRLRLNIEGKKLNATDHVNLLGLEIDSKLRFSKPVKAQRYKVNIKIIAFSRLNNFTSMQQAEAIYNAAGLSNFNYCPLIWMFCYKSANKQIDRTHKRALQILYKDYGYVYTEPVQFGAELKVLLICLPSALVLRNRCDSDPAIRYSFDPATKADYS